MLDIVANHEEQAMSINGLFRLVILGGIILIVAAFFAPRSMSTTMVVVGFLAIPIGLYLWLFAQRSEVRR
jgi:hypothetical protein